MEYLEESSNHAANVTDSINAKKKLEKLNFLPEFRGHGVINVSVTQYNNTNTGKLIDSL